MRAKVKTLHGILKANGTQLCHGQLCHNGTGLRMQDAMLESIGKVIDVSVTHDRWYTDIKTGYCWPKDWLEKTNHLIPYSYPTGSLWMVDGVKCLLAVVDCNMADHRSGVVLIRMDNGNSLTSGPVWCDRSELIGNGNGNGWCVPEYVFQRCLEDVHISNVTRYCNE